MAQTVEPRCIGQYAEAGTFQLERLIDAAHASAATGCQQCRIDAIALQAALEWLRALREFQRGMFPELHPAEPDPPTSGS